MGLVVFPVTEIAQDARLHLLSRAHIKNNFDYFITVSNPLQIKKKKIINSFYMQVQREENPLSKSSIGTGAKALLG